MRGEEAERGADDRRDRGRAERDQQRDADRHEKARQHVAAELVGAEPVRDVAGRREPVAQVQLGVAVRRDLRGEGGDHQHGDDPADRDRDRDWYRRQADAAADGAVLQRRVGHACAPFARRRGSRKP